MYFSLYFFINMIKKKILDYIKLLNDIFIIELK